MASSLCAHRSRDRTDGDGVYTWPHVLPGGRGLLYIVGSTTGQQSSIAVFDARTRTSRKLMHGAAVAYAPSGHLVLVQDNGSLAAVRFDLAKL